MPGSPGLYWSTPEGVARRQASGAGRSAGSGSFPGRVGGPNSYSGTGGGAGIGGGGSGGAPKIDLAAERRKILDIFSQQQQQYNQPDFMALQDQIAQRSSGQAQPFTPGVVGGLLAENADSAASGFDAERDMIRQQMANAGLGGSGMEMSSLLGALGRQGSDVLRGRREIRTRTDLENFGAAERAQQQAQSYLQQRALHQQQAAMAKADFRSKAQNVQTLPAGMGAANPFNRGGWEKMLQAFFAQQQQDQTEPFTPTWTPPSNTGNAFPGTGQSAYGNLAGGAPSKTNMGAKTKGSTAAVRTTTGTRPPVHGVMGVQTRPPARTTR